MKANVEKMGIVTINGKKYPTTVDRGERFINGLSVEDFIATLDLETVAELSIVGQRALIDEKRGTKPRSYQKMMDRFFMVKTS